MPRMKASSVLMLSDVSVGFGTPQVISITKSLCDYFDARGLILEPDQPERPPVPLGFDNVDTKRLYTSNHPYSYSGRVDFCLQALAEIERMKPDVIIFSAFQGIGAILKMKHKPKLLIYYGLEHTDGQPLLLELFPLIADKIDIAIFPEETRALIDAPRLKLERKPNLIIYNGSSADVTPLPAHVRNRRIFYGGLIHPKLTYGDLYLEGPLDDYPIDMFGLIDGFEDTTQTLKNLAVRKSRVSYNGYVKGGQELLSILRHYHYSIVMWAPVRESFQYAAPNKFFDAIQAGVPVITAPHPMCKRLVERYGCGIVLDDWSLDALKKALEECRVAPLRGDYAEMVEERMPIARRDLCWDRQFEKLAHFLDTWDAEGIGGDKPRTGPLAAA